jgi:crotonobetaine/carnitine-CoA ligase
MVTGPLRGSTARPGGVPERKGQEPFANREYAGTIPRLLAAAADRDSGGIWLRSDEGTLTFAGAVAAVGRTAAALAAAGARKGDLIMLTAATTPSYLLSWLGVTSLGAVAVAVNPRSSAAELAGLIRQVGPRLLVTDAGLAGLVESVRLGGLADGGRPGAATFPSVCDIEEIVPADRYAPASATSAALPHADVGPDDLAVLIPTSGTTGRSKLVMQTHRAYAMAGEGFPFWMELTAADRMMTTLPLFHVNAPAYSVMGSLACGAGLVLAGRFSPGSFLDTARRHGATEFNAIGAMLEILMRQPERADDADTPLRLCYTGPAPERERQLEIERRFGLRIVVGYAMSESPYGLIWPRGSRGEERPYGTLGTIRQHPYLGVINHARVVSADSGAVLEPGETGELELRNPVLTPGYFGMPNESAAVLDGVWLRTGDLVTAHENGTYTFVSRVKEVIRRRGENLSPLEVEEVLATHPSVLESAVVGVPSELSEEEVKAFIVPAGGAAVDFAELRAFAAERLAAFKVPRFWEIIDELPRTPTARVAKHQLPGANTPGEYDADGANPAQPGPARREC